MPLTWSVDHTTRQIRTTASGALTKEDIADYLAAVPAEGALGYRAIFDVSAATVQLSVADLKSFSVLVGGRKTDGRDGIALVVSSEAERLIATFFANQTAQSRKTRLFQTVAAALDWFKELDDEVRG